jgi:hypothetical protein
MLLEIPELKTPRLKLRGFRHHDLDAHTKICGRWATAVIEQLQRKPSDYCPASLCKRCSNNASRPEFLDSGDRWAGA